MQKVLLTLMIASLLPKLNAQEISRDFGRISLAELEMTAYARDASAEAVMLYDVGKSYFEEVNGSFEVVYDRAFRIKIFSEAGLDFAEIDIPFYQEGEIYEKVLDLEAYTYNLEGGNIVRTALDPANCFNEKVNEYWNLRKFAMPEARSGSVIEVRYKIRSQYVFNLRDWEFQARIPVAYSEYEVKLIPFYEYAWLAQGISKFDRQSSVEARGIQRVFGTVKWQDMIHTFVMTDIEAFDDEEYITSINDYIMKIDFQLARINYPNGTSVDRMTTWPDMIKQFIKHNDFGKYVDKSEKLASKLIEEGMLAGKTQEEKFNLLVDYVKANYNWNGRLAIFASKSPNDLVRDKQGNAAEINLFMVGLLRAAGLEAYPVMISTRDNGKVRFDYPYINAFNDVLASVSLEGSFCLADATDVMLLNRRIPSRCMNDKGLIVNGDKVEWASLQCGFPSELVNRFTIACADQLLKADITNQYTEYDALQRRKAYGEDLDKIAEMLREKGYEVEESSVQVRNYQEIGEPYTIDYQITEKINEVNGKIYIAPFLNEPLADNPLTQLTRTYPVDMTYPVKRVFQSTVDIPDGYGIDFLPVDYGVSNDLFELDYKIMQDGNQIHISFSYYFKLPEYVARDYSRVRSYFNDIVKKGNEKIVLARQEVAAK